MHPVWQCLSTFLSLFQERNLKINEVYRLRTVPRTEFVSNYGAVTLISFMFSSCSLHGDSFVRNTFAFPEKPTIEYCFYYTQLGMHCFYKCSQSTRNLKYRTKCRLLEKKANNNWNTKTHHRTDAAKCIASSRGI